MLGRRRETLPEAVADYKAAEKNVPADPAVGEPVRRRIRERLYRAYTELLRQNFAASEGFPKPLERLAAGPVWRHSAVERWAQRARAPQQ